MNLPVLSIDVSKGKSVAAAYLAFNEPFRKPFSFIHSPSDLASLLTLVDEMKSLTAAIPHIVMGKLRAITPNHLSVFLKAWGFL